MQLRLIKTLLILIPAICTPITALARQPVGSLLEQRQRHVVMQEWDLSCGAAALTTLLNFQHGLNLTEREVAIELVNRQEYRDNPELLKIKQGFSLLDLKMYVEKRNFVGRGLGQLSLENLIDMAPVLVPVRILGYNHFVIFRGIANNRVLLADPAWGNRTMLTYQFLNAWINFQKFGKVGFVVSIKPPQPLPSKTKLTVTKKIEMSSITADQERDNVSAIEHVHEVKSGETLWRIARLTTGDGTNWRTLADFNNLESGVRILPGQQLKIPADLVTPRLTRRNIVGKEAVTKAQSVQAGRAILAPAKTDKDRDTTTVQTGNADTIPNQSTKPRNNDGAEPTKTFVVPKTSVHTPPASNTTQLGQTDTEASKNLLSPGELDFVMLL